MKCYHGTLLSKCKRCSEVRQAYEEGLSQSKSDSQTHDSAPPDRKCLVCSEQKPPEQFLDPETKEFVDICSACLIERQAHDEEFDVDGWEDMGEEEDGGLRPFGFLDQTIYCFQCDEHLPVASFPPGVGPNDVAICNACQETLDHTPVQPCTGGCGKHVRLPRTGGPAICEGCKDIPGVRP